MESFTNFHHFSPMVNESLFGIFSPFSSPTPMEITVPMVMPKPHEWTREEHNFFQNVLADIHTPSPHPMEATSSKKSKKSKPVKEPKTTKTGQPRRCRRGVPWTQDEHMWFLMGLNKYGKGDWRSISRNYIISKTPTQVASHAQKYYCRLNSTTPASRRRPSIMDIHTVDNPSTTVATRSSFFASNIPSFLSFRHSYGVGAHVLELIPHPLMSGNAYKQYWG